MELVQTTPQLAFATGTLPARVKCIPPLAPAHRHIHQFSSQLRHDGVEHQLEARVPRQLPLRSQLLQTGELRHAVVVSHLKVLRAGLPGRSLFRNLAVYFNSYPLPSPCRLLALRAVVLTLGKGHCDCHPLVAKK